MNCTCSSVLQYMCVQDTYLRVHIFYYPIVLCTGMPPVVNYQVPVNPSKVDESLVQYLVACEGVQVYMYKFTCTVYIHGAVKCLSNIIQSMPAGTIQVHAVLECKFYFADTAFTPFSALIMDRQRSETLPKMDKRERRCKAFLHVATSVLNSRQG